MLGSGAMAVVGGWILFFYTTFCGLTATQAASIFAIARVLDAVASPLIGHLSDGLRSTRLGRRFGRRRVFLLLGLPLLPSFTLMWVPGQDYFYYLLTYVFFELVYASILIPYETLAAEMTDDYRTRARFAGARILVGQVAAIMAGILPKWIVDGLGRESADTFLYMGMIFSALFVLSVGATWALSWERPPSAATEASRTSNPLRSLLPNLVSTLKVRAFRLHLALYLGGYTAIDLFTAVFTYFVVFALSGSVAIASAMLALMAGAQFVGVAAFTPLTVRLHPGPAWRLAAVLYAVGILALGACWFAGGPTAAALAYVAVGLCGLGRGGLIYIPWNTYNYIADVDEIMTGRRREGIFAGVMTLVRKTVQAGAVMVTGAALDAGGFVAGATAQGSGAVATIVGLLTLAPLALLVVGAVASYRFALNRDTHAVLMREIERARAGATAPEDADAGRIVEALTGQPYARLWGRGGSSRPTTPSLLVPGGSR
ncbi:MFS transporter [Sphingomonas lenta]|uniref:MFS transporter n=2 Tax=Sphingomonas lenta TaxID=1141887 RepID=A0A2A2SJ01_9SPHN|nr:MFS transporter [Sphingomonas lenta]